MPASETIVIDWDFHNHVINRFANVPAEEWEFLKSVLGITVRKKNTHLIREGEQCEVLYYLIRGAARFYYINPKGDEVTFNFIFENNFVIAFDSLFCHKPSLENIVLLEDAVLFTLSVQDFHRLLRRHKVWDELLNKLLAKHFLRISEKEKMLLMYNHETRYEQLLDQKPYIFQRVEQQHIASYLGMSPETLSRIKKRIYKRATKKRK